jgi:RimK family alpha-L-glutamate ligase
VDAAWFGSRLQGVVVAIVGGLGNPTNPELERAWQELGIEVRLLAPSAALAGLAPGAVALGRIDVRRTLVGVESGLLELNELGHRGVRVLNRSVALLAAHDKLRTARLLETAGLPHPQTMHLRAGESAPPLPLPVVLKPRFGSWGCDVMRCKTREQLLRTLARLPARQWFPRQGVLVQEFVPTDGCDLRLVVAGGQVVGAIHRRARTGEWRTNISLGGSREPARPPAEACALALAAAAAVGADLVGVDLLPGSDGYTILELNGAVDFDDPEYSLDGSNVYLKIADALDLPTGRTRRAALPARAAATASPPGPTQRFVVDPVSKSDA